MSEEFSIAAGSFAAALREHRALRHEVGIETRRLAGAQLSGASGTGAPTAAAAMELFVPTRSSSSRRFRATGW